VYAGNSGEYSIRVFDEKGDVVRIIRNPKPHLPITSSLANEYRRMLREEAPGSQIRPSLDFGRALADVSWPEHVPAYSRLLADELGNLWVNECSGGPIADPVNSCWVVYAADGAMLGYVGVPPMDVLQIGSGFVLGVRIDKDTDIPEIVVFQILRDSRPGKGT
jgi:hypothetical protein